MRLLISLQLWKGLVNGWGIIVLLADAKEIADEVETEPISKDVRKGKRKFPHEGQNEPVNLRKPTFKIIISMLSWTKLYHPSNRVSTTGKTPWIVWFHLFFPTSNQVRLQKTYCSTRKSLTVYSNLNIDAEKMNSLKEFLPPDIISEPLKVLCFLYDRKNSADFPNFWTILRILLKIPVTVISGERSYSKLKFIKTYLKSTM